MQGRGPEYIPSRHGKKGEILRRDQRYYTLDDSGTTQELQIGLTRGKSNKERRRVLNELGRIFHDTSLDRYNPTPEALDKSMSYDNSNTIIHKTPISLNDMKAMKTAMEKVLGVDAIDIQLGPSTTYITGGTWGPGVENPILREHVDYVIFKSRKYSASILIILFPSYASIASCIEDISKLQDAANMTVLAELHKLKIGLYSLYFELN